MTRAVYFLLSTHERARFLTGAATKHSDAYFRVVEEAYSTDFLIGSLR